MMKSLLSPRMLLAKAAAAVAIAVFWCISAVGTTVGTTVGVTTLATAVTAATSTTAEAGRRRRGVVVASASPRGGHWFGTGGRTIQHLKCDGPIRGSARFF